jgi:hypothetical protein
MTTHRPAGLHLLADLHGIAPALLTDPAQLDALLREAALAAGARILHSHFHAFGEGQGVTGCWPNRTSRSTPGRNRASPRPTCSCAAPASRNARSR